MLVRSGTIPMTSSGKIQRHACRAAFLAGKLKALAEHCGLPVNNAGPSAAIRPDTGDARSSTAHLATRSWQAAFAAIRQYALALPGAALPDLTPDTPLAALGLDSLQSLDLVAKLEETFACRLPDTVFSQVRTLEDLVQAVQKHLIDVPRRDVPAGQIPPRALRFGPFPRVRRLEASGTPAAAGGRRQPVFPRRPGRSRKRTLNRGALAGCQLQRAISYVGMAQILRSPLPPRPRSTAMAPAPAPVAWSPVATGLRFKSLPQGCGLRFRADRTIADSDHFLSRFKGEHRIESGYSKQFCSGYSQSPGSIRNRFRVQFLLAVQVSEDFQHIRTIAPPCWRTSSWMASGMGL